MQQALAVKTLTDKGLSATVYASRPGIMVNVSFMTLS